MSTDTKNIDVLARIAAVWGEESPEYAAVAELIDKADSALSLGFSDTAVRELRTALAHVQGNA